MQKMDSILINLPIPGEWSKDFYDICESIMVIKGLKNMNPEIILTGINCFNKIIALDTEQANKINNNFKNFVVNMSRFSVSRHHTLEYQNNNTNKNNNNDSNDSDDDSKNNSITVFIPRFYIDAIEHYLKVYSLEDKLFILPNGETELKYRKTITSTDDLISLFTAISNIILPLTKRKKIDCFHIQAVIKMILCNNHEYESNLVNTVNSFARIITNELALANTVKNDLLIKSTVEKFKIGLDEGLSLTNEAAIYLTLFVSSFSRKIEKLDTLIKIGEAKKAKLAK